MRIGKALSLHLMQPGNAPYIPLDYGHDLNECMKVIREKWPKAFAILGPRTATIRQAGDTLVRRAPVRQGDTDAARLAHALADALEADRE